MTPKQRKAVVDAVVRHLWRMPGMEGLRGTSGDGKMFLRFDLDESIQGVRLNEAWSRPPVGLIALHWEPRFGIEVWRHVRPRPGYATALEATRIGDGPQNGMRVELDEFTDRLVAACEKYLRPLTEEEVVPQLRPYERFERGGVVLWAHSQQVEGAR